MNETVRETICNDCNNRDICKYCEDVIKAERKANEINSMLDVSCPASVKVVCERIDVHYIIKKEISNDCSITLL